MSRTMNENACSEHQFMTINEFCQRAQVSRNTFYRLKEAQQAPKITMIGKQPRISRAAFMQWANALPTFLEWSSGMAENRPKVSPSRT